MNNNEILSDKMAVLQVLGSLTKKPSLFSDSKYKFHVDDFPEQFHKIVFAAIEHLANNGVEKIAPIDIDQYLVPYTAQYKVFSDNKGFEYISRAINAVNEENFEYYYQIVKKFSLLNQMNKNGFDISPIYDASLTDPKKISKMQDKFNEMSLNDVLDFYEVKIISLKQQFGRAEGIEEQKLGEGIDELISDLMQTPEMGVSLCSPKMTTMFRGRRLKKFYMESAAQGTGKSRRALGEACHLSIPYFYNEKRRQWEEKGFDLPVLYISTELDCSEIQTMALAYISGISEENILDGHYEIGEEARVRQAGKYLKQYPFYFVQMTNFDVDDIENIIKKYHSMYGVCYVFYDYLSTSMKILSEGASKTRIGNLREDQILLMFSDRLKNLCNTLGIHIQTATQLSGDWKNAKEVDQSLLRSAKSLADKNDLGCILLPIREADKPIIEAYLSKGFETQPNMVLHVFKNRRGKYKDVRLYGRFDHSTCRWEDCFLTDKDGIIINIDNTEVKIEEETNISAISEENKNQIIEDLPFEPDEPMNKTTNKKGFNVSF